MYNSKQLKRICFTSRTQSTLRCIIYTSKDESLVVFFLFAVVTIRIYVLEMKQVHFFMAQYILSDYKTKVFINNLFVIDLIVFIS